MNDFPQAHQGFMVLRMTMNKMWGDGEKKSIVKHDVVPSNSIFNIG
jgi:hypothetical protein